ncbi:MAG: helix-turn-helix domain-containing protein [Streptosporangiaceae bacterium]
MSIGEALAQARRQAGLTVTQVSQRTRIRETLISGIEADDYSSCGGDFYTRGHIRAIARVAGIDSEPLIEEYDAAHRPPPDETDEFSAPPVSGRRGRRGRGGGRGSGGGWGLGGGQGAGGASGTGHAGGPGSAGEDWREERDQRGRHDDGGLSANGGPDLAREPERWPGLGWLGRGQRTDHDNWDDQLRHPEPVAADEPDPEPLRQADGGWTDPGRADVPEREADWSQPAHGDQADQADWDDEELGYPGPGPAHEPERPTGQDLTDRDDWDDQQLEYPGPGQADEPEQPTGQGRAGQDDWEDELFGHRGAEQAAEPGRRGGLGTWLGLGDRDSRRQRHGQMRTMWVVLAAVIGFAIYSFLFAAGHRASATGPHRSHNSVQAAARRHAGHRSPAPATSSPAPTPTPAVPLRAASATAFGPSGTGQGDNPSQAGLAIDHNPATAWHTDWYTSADFGHLYQGTGLLVDMGHPVTIAGAQIALGAARGASLALRVGNSPALAALKTVATATNAGGRVSLKLSTPTQGRYVLVWLTSLPRDPAGTYQASIFNVQVVGRP